MLTVERVLPPQAHPEETTRERLTFSMPSRNIDQVSVINQMHIMVDGLPRDFVSKNPYRYHCVQLHVEIHRFSAHLPFGGIHTVPKTRLEAFKEKLMICCTFFLYNL